MSLLDFQLKQLCLEGVFSTPLAVIPVATKNENLAVILRLNLIWRFHKSIRLNAYGRRHMPRSPYMRWELVCSQSSSIHDLFKRNTGFKNFLFKYWSYLQHRLIPLETLEESSTLLWDFSLFFGGHLLFAKARGVECNVSGVLVI